MVLGVFKVILKWLISSRCILQLDSPEDYLRCCLKDQGSENVPRKVSDSVKQCFATMKHQKWAYMAAKVLSFYKRFWIPVNLLVMVYELVVLHRETVI